MNIDLELAVAKVAKLIKSGALPAHDANLPDDIRGAIMSCRADDDSGALLDAMDAMPHAFEIVYKPGETKTDVCGSIRKQIGWFLENVDDQSGSGSQKQPKTSPAGC